MSEDSKTFEKKLDLDFLYYLSLTKSLYGNVTDATHKQFCEIWLAYLFGKTCNTLAEKCDRNVFISRLLLQMQSGRLNTNFLEPPPDGPLPCAFTAFGLPTEVDGLKGFEDLGYQIDSSVGAGSGDFTESSRDGRTYLATRHLPQGIMAFLAVTNNEGEPAWIPQTCPASLTQGPSKSNPGGSEKNSCLPTKCLRDPAKVPLTSLRKPSQEREKILEWMDKIISDCSKWLQGEDPHNMELEQMFQNLFEEYKKDPENSELLKHPRTVRNILFRDIRNHMFERRAEVSRRELVLDELEAAEYDEKFPLACKPQNPIFNFGTLKQLSPPIMSSLIANYPEEVTNRFAVLAAHDRLRVATEVEKRTKEKIEQLRKTIIEDSKMELQKLKRAQDEYKEYYAIYKDIEKQLADLEKEYKEICPNTDSQTDPQTAGKCKRDREMEIQQAKRNLEREVKNMYEMRARVDKMKATCKKINDDMSQETDKILCKRRHVCEKLAELKEDVQELRQKRQELICRAQRKYGT